MNVHRKEEEAPLYNDYGHLKLNGEFIAANKIVERSWRRFSIFLLKNKELAEAFFLTYQERFPTLFKGAPRISKETIAQYVNIIQEDFCGVIRKLCYCLAYNKRDNIHPLNTEQIFIIKLASISIQEALGDILEREYSLKNGEQKRVILGNVGHRINEIIKLEHSPSLNAPEALANVAASATIVTYRVDQLVKTQATRQSPDKERLKSNLWRFSDMLNRVSEKQCSSFKTEILLSLMETVFLASQQKRTHQVVSANLDQRGVSQIIDTNSVDDLFQNETRVMIHELENTVYLLVHIFFEDDHTLKDKINESNYESYISISNDLARNENLLDSVFRMLSKTLKKYFTETGLIANDFTEEDMIDCLKHIYEAKNVIINNRIRDIQETILTREGIKKGLEARYETRDLDNALTPSTLQALSEQFHFKLEPNTGIIITTDNSYPKSQFNTPQFPINLEELCDLLRQISEEGLFAFNAGLFNIHHDTKELIDHLQSYIYGDPQPLNQNDLHSLLVFETSGESGFRRLMGTQYFSKFEKHYATDSLGCFEVLIKKLFHDLRRQFGDKLIIREDIDRFHDFCSDIAMMDSLSDSSFLCTLNERRYGKRNKPEDDPTFPPVSKQDVVSIIAHINAEYLRKGKLPEITQIFKERFPRLSHISVMEYFQRLIKNLPDNMLI